MSNIKQDRVLALAGVFQAARLAQQLAREGRTDNNAYRASVQSILATDAADTAAVYGGIGGVRLGLELLRDKLGSARNDPLDVELARYVIALTQLEARFRKRQAVVDAVSGGIEAAKTHSAFFNAEGTEGVHPNLNARLAELYTQTLSTLPPRILINGDPSYLSNTSVADRIRTALLAGVRSAYLWHQLGGSRWQLIFGRRRLLNQAQAWLAAQTH